MPGCVPWDEVPESDRGERDEAVVKGVEVVPVFLKRRENGRRHQEHQKDDDEDDL